MKVIKFEVSFKSDGSVAGLVARQAEGGWALRDAMGQPGEGFATAAVRSLAGAAGGPGGVATEWDPGCGHHPGACWHALNWHAVWEPPSCGGQPHGWGWGDHSPQGVGTDEARIAQATNVDGFVELGVLGMRVWIKKGQRGSMGPGPHLSSSLMESPCPT